MLDRGRLGDLAIEVPLLLLSSDQAQRWLGWRPRLATEDAVGWAVNGYRALLRQGGTRWLVDQIHAFTAIEPGHARTGYPLPARPEQLHAYA